MNKETMIGYIDAFVKAHRNSENCFCDISKKYEDYMALSARFDELFPELIDATVMEIPVKDLVQEYACGCQFSMNKVHVKSLGLTFDSIDNFLAVVEAFLALDTTDEDNGDTTEGGEETPEPEVTE